MMNCRALLTKLTAAAIFGILPPAAAWAQQFPAQPSAQQFPSPALGGAATSAAPGVIAPDASAPAEAVDQSYVLGPEDVISAEVLGRADFSTRARVDQDGKVILPYIGSVVATNKTARELAAVITSLLEQGGLFNRPIVRVEVLSYASRYVTLMGAVGRPGLVPINRTYHLSEVIARAGGVAGNAADYVIQRPVGGQEQRWSLEALATGDASQDPVVAPGDKIFVPIAEVFYISGQVNSAGTLPMKTGTTLRTAIARAGGLTTLGSDRRVTITRAGQRLKGVDLETKVEPGDIIVVKERLF